LEKKFNELVEKDRIARRHGLPEYGLSVPVRGLSGAGDSGQSTPRKRVRVD
jgi:hypothetical protein